MRDQGDRGKRWQVSMSWLSVYVICSVYGLSVVPGRTYLLLIPVLVGTLVIVFLKKASSKKALGASTMFSLVCGFSMRKLVYEPHGATSTVFLFLILIGVIAIIAGYFVYFQEKEGSGAESEDPRPKRGQS